MTLNVSLDDEVILEDFVPMRITNDAGEVTVEMIDRKTYDKRYKLSEELWG